MRQLVDLVWNEEMRSGNQLIDAQHLELLQLGNELSGAVHDGASMVKLAGLMDRLVSHVVRHFRDEELLLVAARFPGVAGHQAEHNRLLDRFVELQTDFVAGRSDLGPILKFLVHDVVAIHLLGSDRAFFPYVKHLARPGGSLE